MSKNTGGPAFPHVVEMREYVLNDGMTLRDYFAAKVLCGYMSTEYPNQGLNSVSIEVNDKAIAHHCYAIADAMLSERDK